MGCGTPSEFANSRCILHFSARAEAVYSLRAGSNNSRPLMLSGYCKDNQTASWKWIKSTGGDNSLISGADSNGMPHGSF